MTEITSTPTLLAFSRAEQEAAKRWFVRSRGAHVLTLALTIPALFLEGKPTYFLALAAVATEGVAWTYRMRADRRHSLAEEGRRRALLCDAFATPPGALAIRDLRANFSKRAERTAHKFEDANYYSSTTAPGHGRLRDHLQESAFWSSYLYAAAARAAAVAAGVVLIVVIVALFVAVGTESSHASLVVARVGAAFLSFLVFSDVVTQALAWHDASAKARDVTRRLERDPLDEQATALAVFGDYSAATATTPPIPSRLYNRHHDRIDRAWHAAK
jgi:hypothetical protein